MTRFSVSCPVIASICLAAFGAAPCAQQAPADPHAVQPERPTVATHAGTVAAGWLEIEAGGEFDRYADRTDGLAMPILFKVGLAPRLQLSVQMPVVGPAGGSTGFGDLSVGVKWRLATGASVVGDFAVQPGIKVPTGSAASLTGTGTTDVSLLVISSHAFGPVAVDLNVGYTRRGGDGTLTPRDASVWTASFGGPWRGRAGWAAEVYGYPRTSGPAGAPSIIAVLVGPTWLVRRWLVLDGGVIVPVTGPQPRAVYAGLTYNVGRLWPAPAR